MQTLTSEAKQVLFLDNTTVLCYNSQGCTQP